MNFIMPYFYNQDPCMSSVSRVVKKRREAQKTHDSQEHIPGSESSMGRDTHHQPQQQPQTHQPHQQQAAYNPQRQKQYQQYSEYSQYNPQCFQFSNTYNASSLALYNRYRSPMSCFINPINSELQYVEQAGGSIPRCASCRAYMNYYNQTSKKGFKCFLCGRENPYEYNYALDANGVELNCANYLVDGPNGVYNAVPPELTYIFLIDVSRDAAESKMLGYMINVIKDVFDRADLDLDDTLIYFYTFDDTVHEYDFSGDEAQRTVIDFSLKPETKSPDNFIGNIKTKLFNLLDSLEQMAQKNTKQGSKFYPIFEYVYESTKHTGGKIFLFQANEAIAGENFTNQNFKWSTNPQDNNPKIKSLLQTKNKMFFNRFVQPMLTQNISIAFFIFSRGKKNIKVFSDTCKLTNSQLMLYQKDNPEDLTKFYYEFYHLLSSTYYIDTRMEFLISTGWYYTAVYGNLYRLKQYITFKFCHFQQSKRVCAVYLPQDGFLPLPYFAIQIVTNYIYKRKHYMAVNTGVIPFTTSIDRLFQNMNIQLTSATFFKIYLSSLRLEDLIGVKNKYLKHASLIWKASNDFYKGNHPPEFRSMMLSYLGFLKSYHSQIDIINNTHIIERIISQRNILQSCSYSDVNCIFSPYLFDLTTIDKSRCKPDNFIYPDACELRFDNVKQGMFLMDAGVALYLFVSKNCHPNYIYSLFGKQKLLKTDHMSEQVIAEQHNQFSQQVLQLVRVLRQTKTYGWIPLYVIRCGENSQTQKNFYTNFFQQKYDEFKTYKLNFEEFIAMLNKHH